MRTATLIGSDRITSDPLDMLIHYGLGELPCYLEDEFSPVAWHKTSHRGVHRLERITICKSQRRYVFARELEFRINTAFDDVVRGCADVTRFGHTWIGPELIEGYGHLHHMGMAHSFEVWKEGQLVGGCFGVQIGGWMSIESTFYKVSHASKAAYGRALLHIQERGFSFVDSNPVEDTSLNYGEEWVPQWKYEEMLRAAMDRRVSILPEVEPPELPWQMRQVLPLARLVRKLTRKLRPNGSQ